MDLSLSEMLAVAVIALLVFGPEELVRKSRKLGQWVGKIKTGANNFKIMTEEAILSQSEKKELKDITESQIEDRIKDLSHKNQK